MKNKNNYILIPNDINININYNIISIIGKLGGLNLKINNSLNILFENNKLIINYILNKKFNRYNIYSYFNTILSIIKNMIYGVSFGYSKKLLIIGIGYKFELFKDINLLEIKAKYSHIIKYLIPDNIKISCINNNEINIFGIDKQLVGKVASEIRNFNKPDSYKGKGIRYSNEKIILKEFNKKK